MHLMNVGDFYKRIEFVLFTFCNSFIVQAKDVEHVIIRILTHRNKNTNISTQLLQLIT